MPWRRPSRPAGCRNRRRLARTQRFASCATHSNVHLRGDRTGGLHKRLLRHHERDRRRRAVADDAGVRLRAMVSSRNRVPSPNKRVRHPHLHLLRTALLVLEKRRHPIRLPRPLGHGGISAAVVVGRHVATNCTYEHCNNRGVGATNAQVWTEGQFHACLGALGITYCQYKYPQITIYYNGSGVATASTSG
jgi:hypothetical protein